MSENETKACILEVATELFARRGFEGASIRDIAKAAGVNLAAINYHFQNKQNLYFSVMDANCLKMEKEIAELALDRPSVTELTLRIFDYFIERSFEMRNSFKIILTEATGDMPSKELVDNHIGPPGGEALFAAIEREVGNKASDDAKIWATRVIFSQITHFSLIVSSSWIKQRCTPLDILGKDYQKLTFKNLVIALLSHIQSSDWQKPE